MPFSVASVSGRGRYVAGARTLRGAEVSLGTLGAGPLNILEGDFRAIADGNLVLDGTRTEDYPDRTVAYLDVAP